jgi:Protein of unknown function VcgC/VcgE (DUF2780)
MSYRVIVTMVAFCVLAAVATSSAQLPTNPSPELIGQLTKKLSISPEQAIGGSGAIFGLAKTRLNPEEFLKVSDAVPGMDGLLKAAPQPKQQGTDPFSSVTSALPGSAKSLSSLSGAFSQLGLSPDMASKFVPVLTDFVKKKGGKDVAKILSGAFK